MKYFNFNDSKYGPFRDEHGNEVNIPVNRPIYALSYNPYTPAHYDSAKCEPILGYITPYSEDPALQLIFVPANDGPYTPKRRGVIPCTARSYADTHKEAVEMYNELVDRRIAMLNELLAAASRDRIKNK